MKTTVARYACGVRRPSSSTVKHWTLKITLCSLGGAVVTWAVAWGCALWGWDAIYKEYPSVQDAVAWPPGYTTGEHSLATRSELRAAGHRELSFVAYDPPDAEGRVPIVRGFVFRAPVILMDTGWPVLAMRTRCFSVSLFKSEVSGIVPPHWLRPDRYCEGLPLAVLPLGFALDTLLYGGVVLGVVEGVGFARRRHRRNKGRCAACGYDRRGLAADMKCPECGG